MLNAVIDIGSTSVRLMATDGSRVQKKVNTTRLAEHMGEGNLLQSVNLERTAQAVAEYYFEAVRRGADKVYAFATEAVRSARNKRRLIERIKELCGLEVDVLSKKDEAETGFSGAYSGGECCVIDMGGASTELSVGRAEGLIYSKSIPYGIVRLAAVEKAGVEMTAYITERLELYGQIPPFERLIAIGGTISTMSAMLNGLEKYNPNIVNGSVITLEQIEALYAKIKPMPYEKRKKLAGLPALRADIIAPGILMYALLLKKLGADSLTVSEGDNTEGYLIRKNLLPVGFKAVYEDIL